LNPTAADRSFSASSVGTNNSDPGAVHQNPGLGWDYYDMTNIPWSQLRVIAA